jgi:hypothetical protein
MGTTIRSPAMNFIICADPNISLAAARIVKLEAFLVI